MRRLLATATAGVLALVAVSACRDLPTVAAYVGDTRLTNAQVEQVVHEFPEATRERASGQIRQIVVSDFLFTEVGRQVAVGHGVAVQAPDVSHYQDTAANDGVPLDSGFIRSLAEAGATLDALTSIVTPQAPTEADQREVYAIIQAEAQQQGQAIAPFDQVKDQIDSPQLRTALAVRPLLRDGLKKYNVVVNPRYQPIGVPVPFALGQGSTQLVIPLETNAPPAVTDVSSAPQS